LKRAKESIYGSMKPVPHSMFTEIYEKCGLDVDDRRKRYEMCVAYMESDIVVYINFVKALPGFMDFRMDDRVILLRGIVMFESYLCLAFRLQLIKLDMWSRLL
jgi:hypothetical protein